MKQTMYKRMSFKRAVYFVINLMKLKFKLRLRLAAKIAWGSHRKPLENPISAQISRYFTLKNPTICGLSG